MAAIAISGCQWSGVPTMSHRILLVEDEEGLRITLRDRLSGEGYEVETAADGALGFERAGSGGFDLILLDVMLPAKSGIDVCRDLRRQGNQTPILMLTAKSQTIDKILGLKIGADDYLTKPFEMLELLARIEALLRRSQGSPKTQPEKYEFGVVRVDLRGTRVFRGEEELSLSAKEFQLLQFFIEHRGETLARDKLLEEVWGHQSAPSTRTVDVHVAWLRQKIEPDARKPQWIVTVHGLGYRFAG